MKITDVLNEVGQVYDGTQEENAQAQQDLVDLARDTWMQRLKNNHADPANEREWVQRFIATNERFAPAADTQGKGLFRKAAQSLYRRQYHPDDPNWPASGDKYTYSGGNSIEASDALQTASQLGGEQGNAGSHAAFQDIQDKKQARDIGSTSDLAKRSRAFLQGKGTSAVDKPKTFVNPASSQMHTTEVGDSVMDDDAVSSLRARSAAEREQLATQRQENDPQAAKMQRVSRERGKYNYDGMSARGKAGFRAWQNKNLKNDEGSVSFTPKEDTYL